MVRQLEITGSAAVVAHPSLLATVRAAAARVPSVREVICTGADAPPDGVLAFSELARAGREQTPVVDVDLARHPLLLLFSSGTTGPPKGVTLTNYSVGSNMLQTASADFSWETPGEDVYIGVLPIFHLFGMYISALKGPYLGTSSVLLSHFEPQLFLDAIKKHQPSHLHLVPPLVTFLTNSPDVDTTTLQSVKVVVCAAAPLGKQLQKRFCQKTDGKFNFIEGFGMTETSPVVTFGSRTKRGDYPGTCGVLVHNTEAKMISVEDGRELEQGEIGEICVRGPQVMAGYYRNPEATAATIDSDGWLHTGDVGYCNDDGFFFIVDRVKELIKYKGFQVAPASLEDLLRKHAGVADAAVIGVPDEEAGELPRAYVVTSDPAITEQQLADFVNRRVNPFSRLRGGVRIVDAIPKSATGKTLRRQLRQAAERELAAQRGAAGPRSVP
ncbi:4-coumarate--CoA ligase 1-like [Amphibalanus amphitrite]|uniref:4-coumarate--CoA ligase 1-like n=1 Tax=Amphibalanus amphitrite TaxID=1232801 RepID=UPI001C912759|nr:4-coumarate--CoA ligase 1-like [Amphibalanus amphitrite]